MRLSRMDKWQSSDNFIIQRHTWRTAACRIRTCGSAEMCCHTSLSLYFFFRAMPRHSAILTVTDLSVHYYLRGKGNMTLYWTLTVGSKYFEFLTSIQSKLQKTASSTCHPSRLGTDSPDFRPHLIHGFLDPTWVSRQIVSRSTNRLPFQTLNY